MTSYPPEYGDVAAGDQVDPFNRAQETDPVVVQKRQSCPWYQAIFAQEH
jgi:hypothetical protein